MPETKVPAIKNIPAKTDPETKLALESIKEAVEVRLGRRGDPKDRAVTLRELIESGLATDLAQSPYNPNTGATGFGPISELPGDVEVPPTPINLRAETLFKDIALFWHTSRSFNPPYGNHASTEIWRSQTEDLSSAIAAGPLAGGVGGFSYTDTSTEYDRTYYYWVRYISTKGVPGPWSNMASATTVEDIGATMRLLSEELSNLPGYNLLQTGATAATIIKSSGAPSARPNGDALQLNDMWFDTDDGQIYTRNAANNAWVAARDATLVSVFGTTSFTGSTLSAAMASAQSDVVTLTNNNTARASEINSLTATVSTKAKTFVQDNPPTAIAVGDLWIDSNDNNKLYRASATGSSNWVAVRDTANDSKITVFTQTSQPTANNTGDLWFDTDDSNKQYRWDGSNWVEVRDVTSAAAITSEASTRASADSANATLITNLSASVGSGNDSGGAAYSASNTIISHVNATDANAAAAYVLKVEANGAVAGMVLEANASGSSTGSAIQFQADKFAIWDGSGSAGSNSVAPFIVDSGVVYIDVARIKDGTIAEAKIGTLSAEKITTGFLNVSERIDANVIDGDKIKAGTIGAREITADSITADEISSDTITANELLNANTLNVKHFDNVSTDIKSHLSSGAYVPLSVEANVQSWSGTYPGQTIVSSETSSVVNIGCTTANVRNSAKYRVVVSGVYGDIRNGTIQYSYDNFSSIAATLSPTMNANAGTYRTYVFVWDGQIAGLSTSQSTVYWRINWNVSSGQVNSTYQAMYVTLDNTQ